MLVMHDGFELKLWYLSNPFHLLLLYMCVYVYLSLNLRWCCDFWSLWIWLLGFGGFGWAHSLIPVYCVFFFNLSSYLSFFFCLKAPIWVKVVVLAIFTVVVWALCLFQPIHKLCSVLSSVMWIWICMCVLG